MNHVLKHETALNDTDDGETPRIKPKARRCLRCETDFESTWSGERICPRCKGSSAWRNGDPLPHRAPPASG